jgi:hypothetical protein
MHGRFYGLQQIKENRVPFLTPKSEIEVKLRPNSTKFEAKRHTGRKAASGCWQGCA